MLRITVKFGVPLRSVIGRRRLALTLPEGALAVDLLAALERSHPGFAAAFRGDELGRETPYIFFLNSRPVTAPNIATARLHDGDVVHLLLPVVGGNHG